MYLKAGFSPDTLRDLNIISSLTKTDQTINSNSNYNQQVKYADYKLSL